jgi:hypothetical protein
MEKVSNTIPMSNELNSTEYGAKVAEMMRYASNLASTEQERHMLLKLA